MRRVTFPLGVGLRFLEMSCFNMYSWYKGERERCSFFHRFFLVINVDVSVNTIEPFKKRLSGFSDTKGREAREIILFSFFFFIYVVVFIR